MKQLHRAEEAPSIHERRINGTAILAIKDDELRGQIEGLLRRRGYACRDFSSVVLPIQSTDPEAVAPVVFLGEPLLDLTGAAGLLKTTTDDVPGGEAPYVVLVSAELESEATRTALRAGADDTLTIPVTEHELDAKLTLIERRLERERRAARNAHEQARARTQEVIDFTERQAREMKLLHQVRTAIAIDIDLGTIFSTIVDQVAAAFGYRLVSLYTLDEGILQLRHQLGYDTVLERIPIDKGVAGRVARTGRAELVSDVAADPAFLAAIPGLVSEVCVPFFRHGEVAGILNVESSDGRVLGEDDLNVLLEVTGFLNLAVERSSLHSVVHASEQRLRLALDAAGMGTWVWNPITGDVQWSEQMGPLYGLPPGTLSLSAEQWFELVHPDDRDLIERADRQFLRFGNTYQIEFRVVLPSGAVRWLEGKGKVVERGPEGEVTSIVGVTMDITGRKRLEEERLRLVHVEAERAQAKEAQRLITDTLERLTAAFVAVDHTWRITFCNQRALDMLERDAGQPSGRDFWQVFSELAGSEVEAHLRAAAVSQDAAKFDARWPGLDLWLEVHAYPGGDGLSIYLQDVTERREAEAERRRIEDRFRSLVQSASDIILILGHDGTVRYASPAIERVIGHRQDEVIGSDNFFRVHPQDAKRLRRAFVKVAKTPGVSQPIVLRFRHRNGGYRWLEVTATNLFHDPSIQGIVANCRDVTERHEAEYNLWFLAETSAVLGTSLDLQTTLMSIARLVVMNLADMCIVDVVNDFGAADRFSVAHRDPAIERRLHAFREKHPINAESGLGPGYVLRTGRAMLYQQIDDEMQPFWLSGPEESAAVASFGVHSAIVAPLIARGTTIGVLTVASSVAGRFTGVELGLVEELARRAALAVDNARLYRAARTAVEARDQFLSVAAHELRTPITAITGFSALLQREIAARNDPDRVIRFSKRLADAGVRLTSLVDDMLDVSRIRLGQLPLRIAPVDLAELSTRVAERYQEQDLGTRHQFVVYAPPQPCVVPADDDRLEQVLSNVIDNAMKYSPEGGEISISLLGDEDGYLLRVSDSGIGLPVEELDMIFRPFGRAANAVQSNLPGLGIGLYICRNIIERHGGRIWAESEGEQCGATVAIWLPLSGPADDLPLLS